MEKERILTIGMAVYDDPRGVWMTIEGIKTNWPELSHSIEFLVVDNNPYSSLGEDVQKYVKAHGIRGKEAGWRMHYVSAAPRKSTSLRNLLFHCAETEYVMCVDSHIILMPGSLDKLVNFCSSGAVENDLYHGPAYSESNHVYATHMNPAFRGQNFGTWGVMRGKEPGVSFRSDMQPFEIPMHGMGLFMARRESWLQFPICYRHFSGEEGYIQEKYRLYGRKCWCLPFLGWKHHYGNIRKEDGGNTTSYPNTTASKLWNHLVAFHELSLSPELPAEYFPAFMTDHKEEQRAMAQTMLAKVAELQIPRLTRKLSGSPFCGFPIRINDKTRTESQDYSEFEKTLEA